MKKTIIYIFFTIFSVSTLNAQNNAESQSKITNQEILETEGLKKNSSCEKKCKKSKKSNKEISREIRSIRKSISKGDITAEEGDSLIKSLREESSSDKSCSKKELSKSSCSKDKSKNKSCSKDKSNNKSCCKKVSSDKKEECPYSGK